MHWALRKAPPPSSVSLQSSSVGCVYPPIYSSLSGRHLIIIMTIVSDSGGKSKYTCTHYRRRGVTICTYVGTKIQKWRDTNKTHRHGEQDQNRTEPNQTILTATSAATLPQRNRNNLHDISRTGLLAVCLLAILNTHYTLI